ncbi:hypothetical protein LPB67_05930, partial [Undibacterium sp. Jales W-56]|uniref:hypothetical protein n=1 Tax=Undibacterium sp. Jales W-56 TaxID=2897325 RepID=UPI0021D1A330
MFALFLLDAFAMLNKLEIIYKICSEKTCHEEGDFAIVRLPQRKRSERAARSGGGRKRNAG